VLSGHLSWDKFEYMLDRTVALLADSSCGYTLAPLYGALLEITAHAIYRHYYGAVEGSSILSVYVSVSEFSSQGDSPSPVVYSH
jgi:hypothetical protein